MTIFHRLNHAFKAAGVHLGLSFLVAGMAALLVFGLWYPFPYQELAGGRELFLLIIIVDLVCGPLLTLVLFNPLKPKKELVRDLSLVAAIQLAALVYGLYTVALARPLYMVFEVDRMKVVTAADIDTSELPKADARWRNLPWTGPKVIGLREPLNADEQLQSIDLSLQGVDSSARPHWWQDYDLTREQAIKKAKLVSALRIKYPAHNNLIQAAIQDSGQSENSLKWLPLTSFKTRDWIVFIDATSGLPKAYIALDGF